MLCDRCCDPLTFGESIECSDQIGDVHHPFCCWACNDAASDEWAGMVSDDVEATT